MKYLLQILFLLFTWFNLSATPAFSKVAIPNYAVSFPKSNNQKIESELKNSVLNFARSNISENSFSQKIVVWESSVLKETRAHAGVKGVSGAGNFLAKSGNEVKTFLSSIITKPPRLCWCCVEGSSGQIHQQTN